MSREASEAHLRRIEQSTVAVAFIGTPHAGSDLASWAMFGTNLLGTFRDVNKDILRTLTRDSETLQEIQYSFGQRLASRESEGNPISITCFYEELAVSGVGLIVPASSAWLFRSVRYSLHANHMVSCETLTSAHRTVV